MAWNMKYDMKWYLQIGWLYEAISLVSAFPLDSTDLSDQKWDYHLGRYIITSLVATFLIIFCVISCLCCTRQRRASKGFQNTGGDLAQEFQDGSTVVSDTIIERGLSGLELQVPRSSSNNRVEFEPLPVERLLTESRLPGKPKPPSPLLFDNEFEDDDTQTPNREWFSPELHIPRERLKYLREIGRGWFGKVVEGNQNINESDSSIKSRGIVVRILTEEASASEKAWFLGEALPYLKLRHRNLLELFGTCLETDPYLLLFESCPSGDLKSFLITNYCSEALINENVPLRMSLDIASALGHMHSHGFAHTDLSTRNCLVSSNLSAKLGDYGIGVEKYPGDYYVVGDRALPIRWSAPESLVCTDTTIETRAITPKANLWSFAILLYEIGSWGLRPYDELGDEQVIEMILSLNFESHLKLENILNSKNLLQALKLCWKISANERQDLEQIIEILRGKELGNFEERWENLKPNTREHVYRSKSLKELRESMDSDLWQGIPDEKPSTTPQARFRLGPDEPIKNAPMRQQLAQESGSETEEESWRGRVERGAYTEKVKQKSKSIADLMVLTHIDSDSEAEWSIGPQINEKPSKRKLSTTVSVGDFRSSMIVDEFDEALRKLRDPINSEKLKNLTRETPEKDDINHVTTELALTQNIEKYSPDFTSTPKLTRPIEKSINETTNNFVDVELWKNALEFELERKNTGFESINFEEIIESEKKQLSSSDLLEISPSAPDTPQSRGDISVDNEDFSNCEDNECETTRKQDDEEDDRKHLSTPDDERSSDSGFRDKESCEEEENNIPCVLYNNLPGIPHSTTEEEQLKILYELDTILDAEYCGSFEEERPSNNLKMNEDESTDSITSQPTEIIQFDKENNENLIINVDRVITPVDKNSEHSDNCTNNIKDDKIQIINDSSMKNLNDNETENDIDDDDSSTMSLRSDNSYVSFNLDEEFVAAIRNELREKLPRAQMAVVESQELRDDDDNSVNNTQGTDTTSWTSNDDEQENCERPGGTVDIAIRYNIYGTPLSPILEERESTVTSECIPSRDDSRDASLASKLSGLSEDVIVIDTRTNQVLLVEGSNDQKNDEDQTCGDFSDDESIDNSTNLDKKSKIKNRILSGAPLPSPEEESKWQAQFPIPLQLQDDLMSTSFSTEHDWDSQDEDDEAGGIEGNRLEVEDEENSSSSGEFVWKRYSEESRNEENEKMTKFNQLGHHDVAGKIDEDDVEDEEEEEFTPSAWDANLAPHRSALRSPEKTLKTGDQKKNVWFKKQRYHCVYEYPKETPATTDCPSQSGTTWEPTSYADWEEMMDEPRLDLYSMDYDESNNVGDEEFFVSSGNRPFQFQAGDGKYVSQFFPGASVGLSPDDDTNEQNDNQQIQLGELRHTRDKLKLNLSIDKNKMKNSFLQQLNDANGDDESDEDKTIDDSDDTKKEIKENSSESSLSKDDASIRSIIRSPDASLEIINNDDNLKSIENESADEISEFELSKTENNTMNYPISSGRPLIISQNHENDDKIDEKKEESVSNDNHEVILCDESIIKPSNIEKIIETRNFIKEETSEENTPT